MSFGFSIRFNWVRKIARILGYLVDDSGNYLVDDSGNKIIGDL